MVLNVTSTASGGGNVYGVQSSSTSTISATFSSSSAIRGSTINVTASGTGAVRGIIVDGPNRFCIRDTIVQVTGTAANIVGVETTSAVNQGSFAELKTSSIYGLASSGPTGTSHDIERTQGNIQLSATDLVTANAGTRGFTVNTEPSHVYFVLGSQINYGGPGSAIATPTGTYYLTPGTSPANFSASPIGVPFAQRVILMEGLLSATLPLPGACVATVNYYTTRTPNTIVGATLITSAVINSGTPTALSNNFSKTFFPQLDYLIIQIVISGASTTANTNIVVGVSLY
jgi:hypothetical protein